MNCNTAGTTDKASMYLDGGPKKPLMRIVPGTTRAKATISSMFVPVKLGSYGIPTSRGPESLTFLQTRTGVAAL